MDTLTAYIGLGSNLGEPTHNLMTALDTLQANGLAIAAVSRMYTTEPQGISDSPWFVNQVAQVTCPVSMSSTELMDLLLRTESQLGRVRSQNPLLRYEPRIIDLDLLLFGNESITSEHLTLPHPRMAVRAFVLVPLIELAPDIVLPPPIGRKATDVLAELKYTLEGTMILQ